MPRRRLAPTVLALGATILLSAVIPATPAVALTPPTIDSSALVRSAPVAPPEATKQTYLCNRYVASGARDLTKPTAAQTMMDLPRAWQFARGRGQKVAVIDTGVTPHPRLRRLSGGGDYVSDGNGLIDCDAHGTLVAGIIAAQPSPDDAFAGVAPDASLISIRQSSLNFGPKDSGKNSDDPTVGAGYGSVRTLANAVVRAVDLGATVINISEVACIAADGKLNDRSLGAAVKYAFDRNVVVVVAAGNISTGSACTQQNPTPSGADLTGWGAVTTIASPAWFSPYVLAVGAVDSTSGQPAGFSLHGPWLGVAAPGTDVVSLDNARGSSGLVDTQPAHDKSPSSSISGTSFATPYVAGTVALVRSRFPELTAAQVISRITRTAHAPGDGHDDQIGYGVIDPVAALTAELPAATSDVPSSKTIAAPAPERTPDHTARNTAIVGGGICLAVIVAVLAMALPHRRVKRLDPDEF